MRNSFRWAILGTGQVSRKFVLGLRQSKNSVAATAASRTASNAKAFARDLQVPRVARSYEEALSDPDVDAVYIATPPSEHRPIALAAIEAGKAVLIEKPLALNKNDAEAIFKSATDRGVFSMEAMWTRFLPAYTHLRKVIESGEIGKVVSLTGQFGISTRFDPTASIYRSQSGGGALLHRGVYPLSLATYLLGTPRLLHSEAVTGETGVDEDCELITEHTNGALALTYSSLRTTAANECMIYGTKGAIRVHPPIYRPFHISIFRFHPRGPASFRTNPLKERFKEGTLAQSLQQLLWHPWLDSLRNVCRGGETKLYRGNGYHYEVDEVMRQVRSGELESRIMPHRESIVIADIIDAARTSWKCKRA